MEVQEKLKRVESLFNQQKEVLASLNVDNFFESEVKIRKLELQKEIIKAIPTTNIRSL